MLPIWLTTLPLCVDKDVLAEALLSFGASSVSLDQDDVSQITDEVNLLIFVTVNFLFLIFFRHNFWCAFVVSNLFVLFVSVPT